MTTLKLENNINLEQVIGIIEVPSLLSLRRPWIYVAILGMIGLLFLINFIFLPLFRESYAISISSIAPQAEPGSATANLLTDINAQNFAVQSVGYVTHPYLTGRGRLIVFAGDNIQIFEYPKSDVAKSEALAIFKRVPRLAAENYFHVFLQGNLIGLYFGQNARVLTVAEEMMGLPLNLPSSTGAK